VLPSIDLRIANMIKALEQVILPALPKRERLARDQAALVIGHLKLVSGQWKAALRFELVTLDDLIGLANNLAGILQGEIGARLREAAVVAGKADRADVLAVEAAFTALGKVVDAAIVGGPDAAPLPRAATDAILNYGARQAWRERIWFKGNGLDPDKAELPEIADALK